MRLPPKDYYCILPLCYLNLIILSLVVALLQSCHSEPESQKKIDALKQISADSLPTFSQEDSLSEYDTKTFFNNGKIRSACKNKYDSLGKLIYPECIYYDSLGRIIRQKDTMILITDLVKEGLTFNKILKTSEINPYQMYYLHSMYPFLYNTYIEDNNFNLLTDRKRNLVFFIDDNWDNWKVYLIYKDSLFYEFPHNIKNEIYRTEERVIGVSFQDINKDNLSDVIILKSAIPGAGHIDYRYKEQYTPFIFLKKPDNTGFIYDSVASFQLYDLPTLKEIINNYKDVKK